MTIEYSKEYMVDYDRARREERLAMQKRIDKALGKEEPKKAKFKTFKKGDQVNHPKYGIGTVFKQEGNFVTVKYGKEKKQFLSNFLELA
jgi:hypothetical protein